MGNDDCMSTRLPGSCQVANKDPNNATSTSFHKCGLHCAGFVSMLADGLTRFCNDCCYDGMMSFCQA